MRIYALLLALLLCTLSFSQECSYTFKGTIIDLHDDSPLAGATIIISGLERALTSDINGKFTFTSLCNKTYSFQVSHPFCATKGFTFKILENTTKTLKLEHHLEELNQVIIEGKAYVTKVKTTNEQTIKNDVLETFSNDSFGDALKSLSGVSTLNTGNTISKPVINGLHSSRVLIINNGVRLEDQEWGSEHAPNIDINSSGNISVIKGASALQYGGDAIGGVIISESAKIPVKDTIYGKTLSTIASNGRGGSFSSKLTKSFSSGWFTNIQGTLKRYGDFKSPNYILSNTGIYDRNFSIKTGLNKFDYGFESYYSLFKNDIGILRASHLGGAQDQINAINSNKPLIINSFTYNINSPKQEVIHHLARIKAFKKLKNIGKFSLQYDFQFNNRLELDVRRGNKKDKASLDLDLKTHTLKLDLKGKINDNGNFLTGIIGRYKNNFANPDTGVRRLIPDYNSYHFGIYGTANYTVNPKWLLETGLRFDYTFIDALKFYRQSFWNDRGYATLFKNLIIKTEGNQILVNPEFHYNNISASLGSRYTINQNYNLLLNYALASRAPNPSELFSEGLHHSASRIEYGDLRFNSEISNKVSINLNNTGNKLSFNINPFINFVNNFIVIEPTEVQQTIRGNFQVWEYRQTKAQLLGFDLDVNYNFAKNLNYKHQFSFIKGYDKTLNNPLISMPPVNTQNSIIYNKKKNNLKLEIQSDFVFRQNEFPNTNFEIFIPERQTTELVDLSTPPKAYHLLNFKSSIDFKLSKISNTSIGININNLFNQKYRDYLNRQRYYTNNLGRNFLLHLKLNY